MSQVNGKSILVFENTSSFLESICELELALFPEDAWSKEQIVQHLEKGRAILLVTDQKLISYILFFVNASNEEVEIYRVGTDTAFQHKGFAKNLLEKLRLLFEPYSQILEVDSQNEKAIGLYNKLGFALNRVRKQYYKNGNDCLEFIWKKSP